MMRVFSATPSVLIWLGKQYWITLMKAILPPYVWGDGDPAGVNQRAIEELMNTARAAESLASTLSMVSPAVASGIFCIPFRPFLRA